MITVLLRSRTSLTVLLGSRASLAIVCAGLLAAVPGGCPAPDEQGNLAAGDAGDAGSAGGAGNAGNAGGGTGIVAPGGGPGQALIGIWRASFFDPTFGAGQVELILMSNGRFQQQTAYQAGSLVTVFGTYRVSQDIALLRLDIERGEPSQACGPLGCTPILYPAGESYGYTLNSANNLVLQNINCVPGTGAVCVFAYARAG